MVKVIGLLKRKPGMSVEAFREYYETKHRVIGEKYLTGYADKYQRRFLNPTDGQDSVFDVILEIWYPDEATYKACSAVLAAPEARAEIIADEEQLFDRSANRFFTVDEAESSLA